MTTITIYTYITVKHEMEIPDRVANPVNNDEEYWADLDEFIEREGRMIDELDAIPGVIEVSVNSERVD